MSELIHCNNYREYLSYVLANRMVKNRRYSLRAFSKSLGLSPAHLSCLLKGKRHLSSDKALEVANRLKLSEEDTFYFVELVQSESAKNELTKKFLRQRLNDRPETSSLVQQVAVPDEDFDILSTWYLIPIMAMTDLTGKGLTVETVCHRLRLTQEEATHAVRFLCTRGFLRSTGGGGYLRTSDHLIFKSPISHQRLRHFHRTMLTRAIRSLYEQSPSERVSHTETLAIDASRLEDAKALTRKYLSEIVKLAAASSARSEIYHFAVHGFRITHRQDN